MYRGRCETEETNSFTWFKKAQRDIIINALEVLYGKKLSLE